MKVLHIVSSVDPSMGGIHHAVKTIVAGLTAENIENEIVSLDRQNPELLNFGDFTITCLGKGKGPWQYNEKLIPWLKMNMSRFDVLVVHGIWLYHSYSVRIALSQLKKVTDRSPRLYVMPHGMLDPYFQKAAGRKLKAMRNWLYWKMIENQLIRNADALWFTCKTELELAKKAFTPYQLKAEVVTGLGIEAPPAFNSHQKNEFYRRCPELEGKPFLLHLGRIDVKKGTDNLISAYTELISRHEQGAASDFPSLVIAGPGAGAPFGRELISHCQDKNLLNTKVFFPGMLTGAAKWGAFYQCDAFILPSHQENFGIAVVEALACTKPVLISNQVNIWTEIEQAGAGIIAADTIGGTRELLERWINLSAESRTCMAGNARQVFERHFSIQPVSKKMAGIIQVA